MDISVLLLAFMFLGKTMCSAMTRKNLWIVRHGQAAHNPRAEAAQNAGCSHEEFMELMRQDDVLDAPTTQLGKSQATSLAGQETWCHLELIVSSPLSRALETADLVVTNGSAKRVCIEDFREINGWLLNAQRRNRSDLQQRFPSWDFNGISPTDELWTPELESQADCAHRGYEGLLQLLERDETHILLVCHGGILRFLMNMHPRVCVEDARQNRDRNVQARFGNCELRKYTLTCDQDTNPPIVTLTEQD